MKMTAGELRQNGHWLQTVAKGDRRGRTAPNRLCSAGAAVTQAHAGALSRPLREGKGFHHLNCR